MNSPTSAATRRRLPAAVIALGVTSLFADVASELIFPLLPAFVASLGASPTFMGLVEGVADATASLLKLATGYVVDRFDRRKPMVLFGYCVAAVVRPLVAFATAPWHVLAVRVTDRIGKGVRSAPRDALIAGAVTEGDAGRAFGFHRAMDHAGAVLGPILATTLLGLGVPLRTVFMVTVIPGILSVIAVLVVREPAPMAAPPRTVSLAPHALPPQLRQYLAILALFALGNSSDAFLLLRAGELGVPVAALPMLWMVFHLTKLVASYLGGDWSDRIPRQRLIVAGWAIYAATYLAFGLASQAWHAWALFIVYGVYYGLTEPVEKALIKDIAPAAVRGRAYGAYNFIVGIMSLPAGLLTGWLWQRFSPLTALSVGGVLALAASVTLLVWSARLTPRSP